MTQLLRRCRRWRSPACVAGGVLYSLGVIFHSWRRLRFQNVIWHCFRAAGRGVPLYGGARSGSGLNDYKTNRDERRDAGDRQDRGGHRRRQRHRQGAVRSVSPRRRGQGGGCRSRWRRRASRGGRHRWRRVQMRRRAGKGHPSRHRGDRAAVRADRAVLLQCRHRRRLRSAVGQCRRHARTSRGRGAGRSMSWPMSMRRGI